MNSKPNFADWFSNMGLISQVLERHGSLEEGILVEIIQRVNTYNNEMIVTPLGSTEKIKVPYEKLTPPIPDFVHKIKKGKFLHLGETITPLNAIISDSTTIRERLTPAIKVTTSELIFNKAATILLNLQENDGINLFTSHINVSTVKVFICRVPSIYTGYHMPIVNNAVTITEDILISLRRFICPKPEENEISFKFWEKHQSSEYPNIDMYEVIPSYYNTHLTQHKLWATQYRDYAQKLKEMLESLEASQLF